MLLILSNIPASIVSVSKVSVPQVTSGKAGPSILKSTRFNDLAPDSMLADPDEKMEKSENFEKLFFLTCFQWLILWKTGGPLKNGQNVCISYTISVGLLIRIYARLATDFQDCKGLRLQSKGQGGVSRG